MSKRTLKLTILFTLLVFLLSNSVWAQGSQPYHFGFRKSKNGNPPSIAAEGFMPSLQKYGAIFLGDTEQKELYLTFDNGYENGYTSKILDILKEKKVPAAFFVTGHYVEEQGDLLRRMVSEGHLIGNHSYYHPDLTIISVERMKRELDRIKQEVTKVTDQKEMLYMRPPRGIFSDEMLRLCRDMGYTNVFWSISYRDWLINQQKGGSYAYENVMGQLHPGAVILLHAVSSDNAEAIGKIIDDARAKGYEFKSLDQMQKKHYR